MTHAPVGRPRAERTQTPNAAPGLKPTPAQEAEALREWRTLDEASRQAAYDAARPGCLAATDALRLSAEAMGCTI